MSAPHESRTRRAQAALRDHDADGLVLFPSPDLHYLSGFEEEPGERHLLLFVPAEGDPTFVVPELYAGQIADDSWVADRRTWADGEDPLALVREMAADWPTSPRLLVDDRLWATFSQDLRSVWPDADWGLASEVLADLRVRKDDAEVDALRRAGALADRVSESIRALGSDAIGLSERELAVRIERELADGGGEGVSFGPIVGSGPNGAKPHHTYGDREIRPGDPVVLDFGAWVDGYPGDQTRTVVFAGDPPAEFETVHETVLAAQQAGVEAVEPGVTAAAVDRAAREVIEAAGYGDRFIHRTGHGVGLEVHEEPFIVDGNDRELEPGMVFSVEPGVYIEGEFGVRIEDLVVVTGDGAQRLNESDRGWRPLGRGD